MVCLMASEKIVAILLAAGKGERMGPMAVPKQYAKFNNKRLLSHTINAFINHKKINHIIVAIRPEDKRLFQETITEIDHPHAQNIQLVVGGKERQNSVYNALEALQEFNPKYVLIHDGVRPFVSHLLINRIIDGLQKHNGVIPVLPITDSIKRVSNGIVAGSVSRSELYVAQTPQGFSYQNILMCHRLVRFSNHSDDSSVMESYSLPIFTVPGDPKNIKITNEEDLEKFKEVSYINS